jgi:hypothetical protein
MRRRDGLFAIALIVLTGCGAAGDPSGAPSAASSASASPGVPTGWQTHEMPNLGLSVALPGSWRSVLDLSGAEVGRLPTSDVIVPSDLREFRRAKARHEPGGDFGLVAIDPSVDSLFGAQWAPDYGDDLDFAGRVDRSLNDVRAVQAFAGGMTPTAGSVAGFEAITIRASRESYGLVVVDTVTAFLSAPSNRMIVLGLSSGPGRLDASFAETLFGTVRALPGAPAGKPMQQIRDRPIDEFLAQLGNGWWGYSGDEAALQQSGRLGGPSVFRSALMLVPEFRDHPETFRGGHSEPTARDLATAVGIEVIRSTGARPTWVSLFDDLRSDGMAEVDGASCSLYRTPAGSGQPGMAALVDDFFVYVHGSNGDLVEQTSAKLGICG